MELDKFDDANDELKYSAQFSLQCIRCDMHEFNLLPTGHAKCSSCGLIYNYITLMKKWVYTSTDVFEEKASNGEGYSDLQKRFVPMIEKVQEEIEKAQRKKRRDKKREQRKNNKDIGDLMV